MYGPAAEAMLNFPMANYPDVSLPPAARIITVTVTETLHPPPPPSHVVAHPLHTSCLITMPQGLSSPCLITMPSFCCSRFSVLVALAFVRHRPPLWDVVAVALQPVVCKGKCF